MKSPIYKAFGAHAILVSWEAVISQEVHAQVLHFDRFVKNEIPEVILETVPAYHSLAIYLKPNMSAQQCIVLLERIVIPPAEIVDSHSRLVTLPVCYETPFALDMETMSSYTKKTIPEIIELHTKPIYTVYFIGFLPGFPYLGGLPKALHVPRREIARPKLTAGSVGIGGQQTGVYPQDSPGGWQIIGKTPVALFQNQQSVLRAGDKVQFESVSITSFQEISEAIQKNEYTLKTKKI